MNGAAETLHRVEPDAAPLRPVLGRQACGLPPGRGVPLISRAVDEWIEMVNVVMLVIRTALQDCTMPAELPGYTEYAQRTRYRLLPGLWQAQRRR